MTSYITPDLNAIFDSEDFKKGQNIITQAQADNRYLRYPTAQGSETFENLNINGETELEGNTTVNERVYQEINPNWKDVNGFYALNENTKPLPNPLSSGVRAVANTWTTRSQDVNSNTFFRVAWSPSLKLFCAIANGGGASNRFETSPDGITWTRQTPPFPSIGWQSIVWAAELNRFVVLANTNNVAYSSDGITWLGATTTTADWYSHCWSPQLNLFVAVRRVASSPQVQTSPDGITWTDQASPNTSVIWRGVAWSPELGLFCAVSYDNIIMTSSDGINWTTKSQAGLSFINICWSSELGLFCAVGNGTIGTSSDGTTWNTYVVSGNWFQVVWSSQLGLFCAVAVTGTILPNNVAYSVNGSTWNTYNTGTTNLWYGLAWSPELGIFCACSQDGGSNKIMTSFLKGRPPTNYNVFSDSNNNISSTGNWSLNMRGTTTSTSNVLVGSSFGNTNIQSATTIRFGKFGIISDNFNLPSASFLTPAAGQLGYTLTSSTTITSISTSVFYDVATITLTVGVWLILLNVEIYKTATGAGNTLLREYISNININPGTGTGNGGYNIRNNLGVDNTNGWAFPASSTTERFSYSMTRFVTNTATTTYYGPSRFIFTIGAGDALAVTGTFTCTRIA